MAFLLNNGMKIIVQPPMQDLARRTLKERLFTRPWKPFERYKIEYIEVVEDGDVIQTNDALIMNRQTYNNFLHKLSR